MKRTLKLRGMQLLEHLKLAAMIMLVFVIMVMLLGGLTFFWGENSTVEIQFNNWLSGSLQLISTLFTTWAFLVFFADGMLDFDSALRFGNHRKNYFIGNFFIYVLIAVASTLLSLLSKPQDFPSWNAFLLEFWANLVGYFTIALLGYAIYKWGWKLLLMFLGINFLGGFAVGIFGIVLDDSLPEIINTLVQWPDFVYKGIGIVILLGLITLYYGTIAKIEIK